MHTVYYVYLYIHTGYYKMLLYCSYNSAKWSTYFHVRTSTITKSNINKVHIYHAIVAYAFTFYV